MDKDNLLKLAGNPDNIPGIYNYCDYWCERCAFTSRCLNFQSHKEENKGDDTQAGNFWDRITENLEMATELLKSKALELGIDLESINPEETPETGTNLKDTAAPHKLAVMSMDYITKVREWFDQHEEIFADKHDEILLKHKLELPGAHPAQEIAELKDFVDVIRWYQHQIHAKLARALYRTQTTVSRDTAVNDSAGSAKVALIGMDRSITAWMGMIQHFPGETDNIIDIFIRLDRLRKLTEQTFPGARSFVRPGFDTEPTHGSGREKALHGAAL